MRCHAASHAPRDSRGVRGVGSFDGASLPASPVVELIDELLVGDDVVVLSSVSPSAM
jgi:hypothetical protein